MSKQENKSCFFALHYATRRDGSCNTRITTIGRGRRKSWENVNERGEWIQDAGLKGMEVIWKEGIDFALIQRNGRGKIQKGKPCLVKAVRCAAGNFLVVSPEYSLFGKILLINTVARKGNEHAL